MPDFGFDGVSSSLADSCLFVHFSTFCFSFCFVLQYVRNPDTRDKRQHTSSRGCVLQPAGYNAIHACRQPAEQEETPHACGTLCAVLLLWLPISSCFCYRTLRSVGLRVCCCVIRSTCMLPQVLQHRYPIASSCDINTACCMFFNSFSRHSPTRRHVPEGNLFNI